MVRFLAWVLLGALASGAQGETVGFDGDSAGASPGNWICGVTGGGAPRWSVEPDATAPSKPNVLRQSGRGAFPWCVRHGVSLADGFVEVRFKTISGREDQAGGLLWRWKDGDTYYVARANALEQNVSLYYTVKGSRRTIQYVDAPVSPNAWHRLRVEYEGTRIRVILDGRQYLDVSDGHLSGAGAVGVWTKADSVTAFDDFAYGPAR